MKFSTYLTQIQDVGIYPIISLLLFVVFFISVTYWAFKKSEKEIEHAENLPLDN